MRVLFLELSSPPFLHPTPVFPIFRSFSTLCQSHAPTHSQIKPSSGSIILFNMAYKTLHLVSAWLFSLMPKHTHTSTNMFQGCPQWALVTCLHMWLPFLPVALFLYIAHQRHHQAISIHLLASAPQEIFPDLLESNLGGFPYAPTAPTASSIRGSASHMRASLTICYTHIAQWLVHSGTKWKSKITTKMRIDLEGIGIKVQLQKNK